MNREIKLLDCTLRDGGYLNDWEFGRNNLVSIFERVVNSNTDIIEIGFLDQRRQFDINRSIMPDTSSVRKIFGKVNKKNALVVGMIDYGTCDISNIEKCSDSYLDGIRVIFKKHLMYEAMEFCGNIKKLGYKVFAQAVSITSYSDEELYELIELANQIKPYAMSMVDTYGLLHKDNLMHYFLMLDKHLEPNIYLGYHAHNNFQLAYSNCMEVLRHYTQRTIIVDATLYGMGKSAGNAPIELLAMHLNEYYEKKYDINQMLEAIDGNIMGFYQKNPWGYNLFFYLAASNHCHPNYVQFLMSKHSLSVKSINEILERIDDDKKLLYNQKHIEQLYYQYQKQECDDSVDRNRLVELLIDREILIIGPGTSLKTSTNIIKNYISKYNPYVIAINFIPEQIPINAVFLSNPRRYIRLANALKEKNNSKVSIIATSNVTKEQGAFDYVLNNSNLIDIRAEIVDNSFIMLLKLLKTMKIKKICCAGLDGYSKEQENYVTKDMEYWFASTRAEELNLYVTNYLREEKMGNVITFITKSHYEQTRGEHS